MLPGAESMNGAPQSAQEPVAGWAVKPLPAVEATRAPEVAVEPTHAPAVAAEPTPYAWPKVAEHSPRETPRTLQNY